MQEIKPQGGQVASKQYAIVDFVVVLDTTGSMSPVIEAVKRHVVEHLIGEMRNLFAKNQLRLDWRGKVLGFGDQAEDPMQESPFITDEGELVSTLQGLRGSHGCDESTFDALYQGINSDWRPSPVHKVVIFFTDEPSGSLHRISGVQDVVNACSEAGVKLFFYGPECDDYMELNRIPKASVTMYSGSHTELAKMDFTNIFKQMAATISR